MSRFHLPNSVSASVKPAVKGVSNKYSIKQIAERRSISYLVHFTHVNNLENIMRFGLLSREAMEQRGIRYFYNDDKRLDGHLNATSLSVSFPNESMFFKYRRATQDESWVVLVIDASVMWEKIAIFCKYNAASSKVKKIPVGFLQTSKALENMFSMYSYENRFALADNDPTDVQAEVMVFDDIERELIHSAYFFNENSANYFKPMLNYYGVAGAADSHDFFYRRAYARTPKHLFSL